MEAFAPGGDASVIKRPVPFADGENGDVVIIDLTTFVHTTREEAATTVGALSRAMHRWIDGFIAAATPDKSRLDHVEVLLGYDISTGVDAAKGDTQRKRAARSTKGAAAEEALVTMPEFLAGLPLCEGKPFLQADTPLPPKWKHLLAEDRSGRRLLLDFMARELRDVLTFSPRIAINYTGPGGVFFRKTFVQAAVVGGADGGVTTPHAYPPNTYVPALEFPVWLHFPSGGEMDFLAVPMLNALIENVLAPGMVTWSRPGKSTLNVLLASPDTDYWMILSLLSSLGLIGGTQAATFNSITRIAQVTVPTKLPAGSPKPAPGAPSPKPQPALFIDHSVVQRVLATRFNCPGVELQPQDSVALAVALIAASGCDFVLPLEGVVLKTLVCAAAHMVRVRKPARLPFSVQLLEPGQVPRGTLCGRGAVAHDVQVDLEGLRGLGDHVVLSGASSVGATSLRNVTGEERARWASQVRFVLMFIANSCALDPRNHLLVKVSSVARDEELGVPLFGFVEVPAATGGVIVTAATAAHYSAHRRLATGGAGGDGSVAGAGAGAGAGGLDDMEVSPTTPSRPSGVPGPRHLHAPPRPGFPGLASTGAVSPLDEEVDDPVHLPDPDPVPSQDGRESPDLLGALLGVSNKPGPKSGSKSKSNRKRKPNTSGGFSNHNPTLDWGKGAKWHRSTPGAAGPALAPSTYPQDEVLHHLGVRCPELRVPEHTVTYPERDVLCQLGILSAAPEVGDNSGYESPDVLLEKGETEDGEGEGEGEGDYDDYRSQRPPKRAATDSQAPCNGAGFL